MHFWLVNSAEPTPVDQGDWRLRRMGILADLMVNAGHEVTWWNSTFFHASKSERFQTDTTVEVSDRYRVRFLHAPPYRKNVSLQRIKNHRILGRKFRQQATTLPEPDLILSSYPTLELCDEANRYGRQHGVPNVIDIRDLWPDLFLDIAPRLARPLARLALQPYFSMAERVCQQATAITGNTDEFVQWGLDRGEREATENDRSFAFGYVSPNPSEEQTAAAGEFFRERGVDPEVPIICFFGSINHHFDFETVFNAYRTIRKQQRVQLVICGDGEQLTSLRTQLADEPDVIFPGWVNGPQIWTLMQWSKFGLAPYVASPNFFKNVANKPIEYLAGDLPILCSLSQGALHRLVVEQDCGIAYDGSADKLASQVLAALDSPQRYEELRSNATSTFKESYSAEHVYGRMINHLADIAAKSNAAYAPTRAA